MKLTNKMSRILLSKMTSLVFCGLLTIALGFIPAKAQVACPTITLSTSLPTLPDGIVGVAYSQTFIASGGSGPYNFAVTGGTLPFGLALSTGGVLSGTPITLGSYTFTVTATDSSTVTATDPNGCQGSQIYTITVACPTITLSTSLPTLPDGRAGVAYSQTFIASGGSGLYNFAVTGGTLPFGLALSTGGVLSGIPTTPGSYTFTVTATDSDTVTATDPNGCQGSQSYTLTIVACPTITLTPNSLPNGVVGVAYSQLFVASGGSGSYNFAVTSGNGTAPAGLGFNNGGGVFSGTPTTAGIYTFTVTVTDSNFCKASQSYTVTISCPKITLTPSSLLDGTVGVAYSQLFVANGGSSPYTFAITSGGNNGTVDGLGFNNGGGLFSGTPITAGFYTIAVTVTDSNFCKVTQSYTLTISCPKITLTPSSLLDGTVGVAYSQLFVANGGSSPYTFAITSGGNNGTVDGLGFNNGGGLFSGTPITAGFYTIAVTVTDSNFCKVTQSYTLTISCPKITLTPNSLLNGVVGVAYSQLFVANGGSSPYTFAITSGGNNGTVDGLGFNGGGDVFSGTPTTPGTYIFAVTVTDSNFCKVTQSYTITISCPTIKLYPNSLLNGVVGVAYSQLFIASGGSSPYTFAITSGGNNGTVAGLGFNGGGDVFSGTPTTPGSYTFTVTVTDSNFCKASQSYTITISCPTIKLYPNSLLSGIVGVAYSQLFVASGGSSPYTFAITSGTLPAGLTLSNGGVLSGIPTATGAYSFAVTVTDNNGCTGGQSYSLTVVNTPTGTNVVIQPIDSITGTTPVTITFSSVSQGGNTSLTTSTSGPLPPAGFRLGNPATYYELSTTAVFSGPVTVCINYSGVSFKNTAGPNLFHFENGVWVNSTTSLDTTNMIICGSVTSFSLFAIFEPIPMATINAVAALHAATSTDTNPGSLKTPLNLNLKVFDRAIVGSPDPKDFGTIWSSGAGLTLPYVSISGPRQVSIGGGAANSYTILVPSTDPANSDIASGSYLVIGQAVINQTTTVYVGSPTDPLATGSVTQKYLQVIQNGSGKVLPAKTAAIPGSLLLIAEPEYLEVSSTEELLPIIYESVDGDWNSVVQADTPAGFVSNPGALQASVTTNSLDVLQFTIKSTGSNTSTAISSLSAENKSLRVTHHLKHKGKDITVIFDTPLIDKKK